MVNFFKRHPKQSVFTVLAIILALVAAAKYYFSSEPGDILKPVSGIATQVETKKPTGIARAGLVENASAITINSGFSGRISEVYVTEGQTVEAGQPLFKLEATFEAGTSSQGPDSYESALKEYNRMLKLYEQGAIPRRQFEAAVARLQAAKQNPASGRNVVNQPVTITAPVDSVVTRLAVSAGSAVQADQQVLVLGGGQTVEVVVPLDQKELNLVRLGAPVVIAVAGQTIKGKVSSIFPEIRESNALSFQARISVFGPAGGLLKAGMAVNVQINTGEE